MLTKFQQLTNFFRNNNDYSVDGNYKLPNNTVIAQARSQEEFEVIKAQKRQLKYIKNQWKNNKNILNQNYLQVEALRIPAYYDYDVMSNHEIIGRALEIYAQETMTKNEKGNVLTIKSKNKKVKKVLETLFYNILNINVNGYSWAYQTIKNGDCFLHLDVDDERGIVGVRQMPVMNMERVEYDYINGLISNEKEDTFFRWKENAIIEFKYWSIAHFRLILDDRRMPYGTSMLEKMRRLWRNILLAEDAMLSIQLIRGIDRLVFYVEVGAIDPDSIDQYIQDFASNYKRSVKVNSQTGQKDLKDLIHGIDQDYYIPKRGNNDSSKIEKLEGKSEMDTTVVDYLMKKLASTLGIPLSYLNLDDRSGADKSLAMQDVNFAKNIVRIQENLLLEFNKIAMTHLILLGMEDELDNFVLSLNNPSIQDEMLRLDLLQKKFDVYSSATDPSNQGISPYSITKAKLEILGFTNDEIIEDIKQQRYEKAVSGELEITNQIIPKSGLFNDIDALYGNPNANIDFSDSNQQGQLGGGSSGGGGGFSGDSSLDDLGGDDELNIGDDSTENSDDNESTGDQNIPELDLKDDNINDSLANFLKKYNKIMMG